MRRSITKALVEQTTTDPRTGALISLLHALRCEDKVVDAAESGVSKRELRKRAGKIATGGWAAEAVRKTIDDMNAAVAGAVMVMSSGGGGGSS